MIQMLPNILSVFRICLVPVFIVFYAFDDNDIKYYAVAIFVVANLSDVLDGYIARRHNAQSQLGKILDPLGDKLMTFSALVCITTSRPVILWAVCIFFVKESLMGIGGLLIRKRAKIEMPPANLLGKASTVVFFTVCFLMLVFSEAYISNTVAIVLVSIAIILMLIAFTGYIHTYVGIMKNRADAAEIEEN